MKSIYHIGFAVLVVGCAASSPTNRSADVETTAAAVTALADEYVREFTRAFPEQALLSGLTPPDDAGLSDNSLTALNQWSAREDAWRLTLQRIDGEALWGREEWITYGLLREGLEAWRGIRVCRYELWPLSQLFGWQSIFTNLAGAQPVGSARQRADAMARWKRLPRYLDTEIRNLREGVRLGYTTPRRNAELALRQIDELLGLPLQDSPFFDPARRDTDPEFVQSWTALLENEIQPAIRRYRDYVRDQYLPAARTAIAITAIPDGLACYRASFRLFTGLDRAPTDTHALGEEIVQRNQAQIKTIGKDSFGTDDARALRTRMENDPSNRFTNVADIRTHAAKATQRAQRELAGWFGRLPKLGYRIEPIPDFLAASATPYYLPAASDGSRPGTYFIKLHEPEKQLYSENELTAFHEGYPGHHLQIALAQEQPGAHPISQLLNVVSFVEGWGRYAEALSEEMGLYQSQYSPIGRRFWPGRGMVVDTGLHVLGWTREQAVQYMIEGASPMEPEALVDRIVMWPGQLTAYDTGAAEIFALRAHAQQVLQDRFDIREFHDRVLAHGAITLSMLRRVVDHWIEEKKQ